MFAAALVTLVGIGSYLALKPATRVYTLAQAVTSLDCAHDYEEANGKGCKPFLMGGFIVPGSSKVGGDGDVVFDITDGCIAMPVRYAGDISSTQMSGQNLIVVEATSGADGFYAKKLIVGPEAAILGKRMRENDLAYERGCRNERQSRATVHH